LPEGLIVAQALPSTTGKRGGSAHCARYGGGGAGSAELYAGQYRRRGDQHRLHRTASGHLPLAAALAHRSRAAARQGTTLEAGMWLIGTVYNFCCEHRSLRLRYASGVPIGDGSNEPRSRLRASSMDALRAAELYRSSAQADRGRPKWLLEAAAHAA
jgi:hypothetical protein